MDGQRAKLLVVDDDRNFRATLSELLESDGYEVRAAANGREALALLAEAESQLALCDWTMPEMGGSSSCGRWRRTERCGRCRC